MGMKWKWSKPPVPLTNDKMAQMVFGNRRRPDALRGLVHDMSPFPVPGISGLTVTDANLRPYSIGGKLGVADLKYGCPGFAGLAEFQSRIAPAQAKRWLHRMFRLGGEQLKAGDDYGLLPMVGLILVTHYRWLEGPEYRQYFSLRDNFQFRDYDGSPWMSVLQTAGAPVEDDGTPWYKWSRVFLATEAEELDELAETGGHGMSETVMSIRELSADEAARREAESYEYMRMDQDAREKASRAEGRDEGMEKTKREYVRQMLILGLPIGQIVKITGLTAQKIKKLATGPG